MAIIAVDASRPLAAIDRLIDSFPRAVQAGLEKIAKTGADVAVSSNNFKDRSSYLRGHIKSYGMAGRLEAHMMADTHYAHWVEWGRGPVYPLGRGTAVGRQRGEGTYATRSAGHGDGANVLRWFENGKPVFRKWVGPARPRYFMRDGARMGRFAARFHMNREMREIIRASDMI